MKTSFKITLLISLFLAAIYLAFFSKYKKPEKVLDGKIVIQYSLNGGFVPNRLVVKKGTEINFKNLSKKPFWPASDFYPTNSNYPGFDAGKPVANGGDWSFKFDDLGEWGYHDHISPINKGIIVVTDLDVFVQKKNNCLDLNSLNYTQRQVCWYGQIKDVVKKKGINEALKLVAKLYNQYPLFAQGCHDATHLIGDEAYRGFRKGKKFEFTVETSYCGYGFYHGFIEAMLYTTGDYNEVRNFCETVNNNLKGNIESPNAIYSCYHGIGHSTFDAHDPSLWGDEVKMVEPAIKTCEEVTKGLEPEKTKQCVTGVFNALATAYSNNLYKLKMNLKDPTWFCRTQKGPYKQNLLVYKKACFMEVSMTFINSTMGNYDYKFSDGARFVANLRDADGAVVSMYSLASDYVHLHENDQTDVQFVKNCMSVRANLFASCLKGTELALMNWGKPGEEYKRAISFCGEETLSERGKSICYTYVFHYLPNLYSKEKRLNICQNEVPSIYRDRCINGR